MPRPVRWLIRALVGVLVVALLLALMVWARSEQLMRETFAVPQEHASAATDPAGIAEGGRLARVHGCLGCHGADAGGDTLLDEPVIGTIVSPDLTRAVRRYSDAQLAGIVRRGVKPDGRTMIVMPSQTYTPLSDEDLARILGFLRALPPALDRPHPFAVGPIGRLGLAMGRFSTSARLVADAKTPPEAFDARGARGRYLARTACAVCHAADLRGADHPEGHAPDLRIAAAYSRDDFRRLMRTGIGLGGRKLGVMTAWARGELTHLDDEEIDALHAYLSRMGG